MAEEEYREYKESEDLETAVFNAVRARRALGGGGVQFKRLRSGGVRFKISRGTTRLPSGVLVTTARQGGRGRLVQEMDKNYSAFKATVEAATENIKQEIRDQHVQTRAEVQTSRQDILAAIKHTPAACVKLFSEFGSLFILFSLALRFAFNITLMNTAFSLFMLFAFALYWSMAWLKQRSSQKRECENPAA